jgi:hypothetical protein
MACRPRCQGSLPHPERADQLLKSSRRAVARSQQIAVSSLSVCKLCRNSACSTWSGFDRDAFQRHVRLMSIVEFADNYSCSDSSTSLGSVPVSGNQDTHLLLQHAAGLWHSLGPVAFFMRVPDNLPRGTPDSTRSTRSSRFADSVSCTRWI